MSMAWKIPKESVVFSPHWKVKEASVWSQGRIAVAMAMAVALVLYQQQMHQGNRSLNQMITLKPQSGRRERAIGVLSTSRPHLYSSGSQAREGGHLQWAGHPLNLTKTITHRSVQSLISEVILDHRLLTVKTSPHHCLFQPPLPERAFST